MTGNRPFICEWREQMADSDLPSNAKLVLHTIALYFDRWGRGAHPSLHMIACRASLHRSTVIRQLKIVERWLDQRKGSGRGFATEYAAIIPERTVIELAEAIADRNVSRRSAKGNGAGIPGQKGSHSANHSISKKVALCNEKGRTVRPHIVQEIERESGAWKFHEKKRTIRLDSDGIYGPCFTLPWPAIDSLATACRIPVEEARAIAEGNAHSWAANNRMPDHPTAYLRTVFASHRDSDRLTAAKTTRLTQPPAQGSQRQTAEPALPTHARQVALVATFFEHGEWSAKVREALGPAPGEPGCRIASAIIEEARARATIRNEKACG